MCSTSWQLILFDLGGVLLDFDGISPLVNLSGGALNCDAARRERAVAFGPVHIGREADAVAPISVWQALPGKPKAALLVFLSATAGATAIPPNAPSAKSRNAGKESCRILPDHLFEHIVNLRVLPL